MNNTHVVGSVLLATWIVWGGVAAAQTAPEEVPHPPAVEGPVGQAFLGITAMPVTAEAAIREGLAVREGALITSIVRGGPADRVGLPLGGVIVALDGQRVDSPARLAQLIRQMPPGQVVELSYYQGPVLFRKKVRLAPAGAVGGRDATDRVEDSEAGGSLSGGSQRPLWDGLGRMLDRVAPESRWRTAPPMGSVLVDRQAWERLQREVDQLRRRVESLDSQVEQLRSELESLKKAGGPPPLDSLPPPPEEEALPSTTTESGDPL